MLIVFQGTTLIGIFVIKRGGHRACANWKSRTNIDSLFRYMLYNIVRWLPKDALGEHACSNDSRLPHLSKKNANGDEVFFFIFLGLNTMTRNGDGGCKRRVTEAMGLRAPNTATYVAFISSEKIVLQQNIQILHRRY